MSRMKRAAAAALLTAGAFLAVRFAVSFREYACFQEARRAAMSVESAFPGLERLLRRAASWHPAPDIIDELGGLALDAAQAANDYGTPAKRAERDSLLERAEASYRRLLREVPTRASAWYDLGRVNLLYGFPVQPYAAKGRACVREAIRLAPADAYINENGVFLHLAVWNSLAADEREFVRKWASDAVRGNPVYIKEVRSMWQRSCPQVPLPEGALPSGT